MLGNLQPHGETHHGLCEALRSLASPGRLALLTASRITLREMHGEGAMVSPLYNIMGTQKLGLFTEEEAREFVTVRRSGVRFSAEQVAEILRRGERHPLRLQALCFHATQANHEQRNDWPEVWAAAEAEAEAMLEPARAESGKAQT